MRGIITDIQKHAVGTVLAVLTCLLTHLPAHGACDTLGDIMAKTYDINAIWADILEEPTVKNVCRLTRRDIDARIADYGLIESGTSSEPKIQRAQTLSKLVQLRGDAPVKLPAWYVFSTMDVSAGVTLHHVARCATLAEANDQYRLYSGLRGFTSHKPCQLTEDSAQALQGMLEGGEEYCL